MSSSRSLTAAQIVNLGEYLNSEFDPSVLTVSQLLGVFGYHNIRYPTPHTKATLVQLFLDEIKPKATKFRRERLKRENSIASDDGITDGLTGQPLNVGTKEPRRSSRRLSRLPEDDDPPKRLEGPKRRRSSAQPILVGPSRNKTPAVQPTLAEESEPEEEELPSRKVSRSKKESTNPQTRRISLADDSGWEDKNIFQSGAESSSPTRPSPVRRTARRSAVRRKSRHSMSAPPQLSPPSSPPKAPCFQPPQSSPPQSKFQPQLPPGIPQQPRISSLSRKRQSFSPLEHDSGPSVTSAHPVQAQTDGMALRGQEVATVSVPEDESAEFKGDKQVISASVRVSDGNVDRRAVPPLTQSRSYLLTLLYSICLVVGSSIIVKYKRESAVIGFCDPGSNTNRALEEFQADLSAIDMCNRENRTLLELPSDLFDAITSKGGTPCPPFSLIPLPHPSTCTPCPEYASCTQAKVTCNTGYLLRPHPILALLSPFGTAPSAPVELAWNLVGDMANGLPGLGPVAFPPHCIEDPKRKRHIGALGKAIEALLGQERGKRVCAGGQDDQPTIHNEAEKWGLEVDALRETMKQKTAPHLLETFDDTFNEAIQQLVQWGSVVFGEDLSGHRYLAHKTPNLTLNCQFTVKSRELWVRWRASILGFIAGACVFYSLRRVRAQRKIESKRVAELVQIALDTLRNQELAHHTDPVTARHPYLSSLQLRDLILQDEHSIAARSKLWDQVERVVEGNANVRINLEEVQGGDEHRVWRWVGNAGRGPEYRKRVQFETEEGEDQVA
ncbi:hypothetical protein PAXRUDRAFT_826550 [Paxillus rubicundulus Ve08.2h10]|uniref:Man1/Src1 C-terminal domain-containing protein n=1 Tax=Paxillus rubicundulus Ve08.2h10 TaxID=930991 RepID=A0A0D0E459_9AGAM|nr:hypothetical protein PAXRUDRAFT_826550 [Paxillus rubicundulus Ve08.2h10]